jgi:hypothetical protein
MESGGSKEKAAMKSVFAFFLMTILIQLALGSVRADPFRALGPRHDTVIVPRSGDGEICPGTELLQHDNGEWDNGWAWGGAGVQPPDYGAWAECFDSDYVCGIQFFLTQTGYYSGKTMDVYVWEFEPDGNPPPGPDPGNVMCVLHGIDPGAPAFWPEISMHDFRVCCESNGDHFIGFWPNWPGEEPGWYLAIEEYSGLSECPRTKAAPGIGYPTGWMDPGVFPWWPDPALGMREYAGFGDCGGTPTKGTTWSRIKSLY